MYNSHIKLILQPEVISVINNVGWIFKRKSQRKNKTLLKTCCFQVQLNHFCFQGYPDSKLLFYTEQLNSAITANAIQFQGSESF